MCGKAFDPRLIVAWPTARLAVMGGEQASKVLAQIESSKTKNSKEKLNQEKYDKLLNKISQKYDKQTSPYYAASRLWIDAIVDPLETRKIISMGIEAANHAPIEKKYNPGVLQT